MRVVVIEAATVHANRQVEDREPRKNKFSALMGSDEEDSDEEHPGLVEDEFSLS